MTGLGKRLDLRHGDVFLNFWGQPFSLENYAQVFEQYQNTAKVGDTLKIVVQRKKDDGSLEEKTLSAVLQNEPTVKPTLKADPAATPAQLQLRREWMSL
jgi:hypothetical protein